MRSPEICAYAAGIIDGEGSIRIRKSEHGTNYAVTVGNKSMEILNWLLAHFGGHIYTHGQSEGVFKWQLIRKDEVLAFLQEIEPYLTFKKRQANLMIELCQSRLNKGGSHHPFTEHELSLIAQIPRQNNDNGWKFRRLHARQANN